MHHLYQELYEIIYTDTKNEFEDEFESRIAFEREEKEKLKNDLFAERIKIEELQKKKPALKEYVSKVEETKSVVSEPIAIQQTQQDIKSLVEQVLKYKEKNQTMLKNEAKQRGISLPKGIKQDEIIVLLMATKDKDLFNG